MRRVLRCNGHVALVRRHAVFPDVGGVRPRGGEAVPHGPHEGGECSPLERRTLAGPLVAALDVPLFLFPGARGAEVQTLRRKPLHQSDGQRRGE